MTNDLVSVDVATKLRQLQAKHGLTLQEMADKCGLPKRSLENYMKLKDPHRPGVDALLGIANGLNVSIDWIVGRAKETEDSVLAREEYAVVCQSVVHQLLGKILDAVIENPETAINLKKGEIVGYDLYDVAAVAMLDFVAVSEFHAKNPYRPKGYFKNQFTTLADPAISQAKAASIMDL